jgi:hypothetical protein
MVSSIYSYVSTSGPSFLGVFQQKLCVHVSSFQLVLHDPPASSSLILIIIGEEYKLRSSSLCHFLQPPVTFSLVGPYTLFRTLLSDTPSLCSSLKGRDKFHAHTHNGKIAVSYILMFTILDSWKDGKNCGTEWQQAFSKCNLLLIWIHSDLLSFPNIWTLPFSKKLIDCLNVAITV